MKVVLDASVAAKWFLPAKTETLTGEALELLDRYAKGQVRIVVPDLFWAEVGHIFWKAVRQGRWLASSSAESVRALKGQRVQTIPSLDLLEEALAIANAFDRTVYDSLYVALAVRLGTDLITADERLANALAARLPVKWLGAAV